MQQQEVVVKVIKGVIATNEVNRKLDRMADSALEDGLEQLRTHGMPLLINHDWHRLSGWTQEGALVREGEVLKLVGYSLLPESEEEEQYVEAQTEHFIQDRFESLLNKARQQLALILEMAGKSKVLLTNGCTCLAIYQPEIAKHLAPKVFEQQDEDGLIPMSEVRLDLRSMTFRYKDIVLFPHKCFRRSMSRFNNLNADFLSYVYRLQRKSHIDIKIRLDPDIVSVPDGTSANVEYDFWWGPKFDDDIRKIKPGVTTHRNSESTEFCHGLDKTEFFWYRRDGQRVFQAEEVRKTPNLLDETGESPLYGQRYVHAIADEADGHIQHLDGSVRIYNQDAFATRAVTTIDKTHGSTRYEKLWRLDHTIDVSIWKALIHLHFRNNETIAEYFGGIPGTDHI